MLRQTLQQKLLQKLSPQQIQLMKMIQLTTITLEQKIKEEMEVNPALDEGREDDGKDEFSNEDDDNFEDELTKANDDFDLEPYMSDDDVPSYKLSVNNKGKDDDYKELPFSSGKTFHEMLEAQLELRLLNEKEQQIGRVLIGNLDDNGYLRRELSAIVDDLAFSQNVIATEEDLKKVLAVIQDLEPVGVGARNLQECLILQIEKKDHTYVTETAKVVLRDHFEAFTKKHYDKIIKVLEIEEEDLKDAVHEILKLNPKPGNSMHETQKSMEQIVPDFAISCIDGQLELQINGRNLPDLKISREYSEMFESYMHSKGNVSKSQKDALLFVKQKIDSAKWFIDAIKQRHNTLEVTMETIMEYQKEYFLTGDETKLKPMILKDISEKVGLDISTISRVANSKYVQTPYGTFLVKSFFSESIATESGEDVSSREVKKILQDAIEAESKKKPLTDDHLAKLLKEKGYTIARRTVAKYREQLEIPVARMRKEL